MEAKTTESSPLLDFLAWLEVNKKAVAGGLIAAAVIGSAIAIYVWHKNSTEAEASEALIGLRTDLMPSRDIEPAKADAFLKIASDYPSTTAGTPAASNPRRWGTLRRGQIRPGQGAVRAVHQQSPGQRLAAPGSFWRRVEFGSDGQD
mgnify:CR=1 FL=1